jgi:hypothetical protein
VKNSELNLKSPVASEAITPPGRLALANSSTPTIEAILDGDNYQMALENSEMEFDGWALVAPFGEHPKSRLVRLPNGNPELQNFIQVLDNASATDLLKKENSFFRKLRRATVGIPVYDDHPDMAKYSPEVITTKRGKANAIGVVDEIRLSNRGLEAHFCLTPEGSVAVENGSKFVSPYWEVAPIEVLANGTLKVRPFKLISVGLTPQPNIPGVDSLANANANQPAGATSAEENKNMLKHLLIGWLAAKGVALANDAGDQAVLDAIQKQVDTQATKATTLENSKTSLDGKIISLEGEKSTLTTQLGEKTTALTNSLGQVTTLENSVKAERKGRAEATVDLVIHQGKVAIGERETHVTALANATNFDGEFKKLIDLPIKFKVGSTGATDSRSKEGASTSRTPRETVLHLANSDDRYKDLSFQEAFDRVLKDHPALAEELKKPAAKI